MTNTWCKVSVTLVCSKRFTLTRSDTACGSDTFMSYYRCTSQNSRQGFSCWAFINEGRPHQSINLKSVLDISMDTGMMFFILFWLMYITFLRYYMVENVPSDKPAETGRLLIKFRVIIYPQFSWRSLMNAGIMCVIDIFLSLSFCVIHWQAATPAFFSLDLHLNAVETAALRQLVFLYGYSGPTHQHCFLCFDEVISFCETNKAH